MTGGAFPITFLLMTEVTPDGPKGNENFKCGVNISLTDLAVHPTKMEQ